MELYVPSAHGTQSAEDVLAWAPLVDVPIGQGKQEETPLTSA
jgi:hypothetical protein